jgi:hypothetical protein
MFRDSRTLDRQHTAGSFREASQKYQAAAEKWFDGSPGSIDRRIAKCSALLHTARSTIARYPLSEAAPYLKAAQALEADLDSLHNLRDAMITGASDFEEQGPPGYREAAHWFPGGDAEASQFNLDPRLYPSRQDWMDASNLRNYIQESDPARSHQVQPGQWDPSVGDYAVKPAEQSSAGGFSTAFGQDKPYTGYGGAFDSGTPDAVHGIAEQGADPKPTGKPQFGDPKAPSTMSHGTPPTYKPNVTPMADRAPAQPKSFPNPLTQKYQGHPPAGAVLSSQDKRWVALESSRFVAANTDALDQLKELAIRAHNHASVATSTYSPEHSAQVCRAFVGAVVVAGRSAYRPPVRAKTAAVNYDDIPAEALFL